MNTCLSWISTLPGACIDGLSPSLTQIIMVYVIILSVYILQDYVRKLHRLGDYPIIIKPFAPDCGLRQIMQLFYHILLRRYQLSWLADSIKWQFYTRRIRKKALSVPTPREYNGNRCRTHRYRCSCTYDGGPISILMEISTRTDHL